MQTATQSRQLVVRIGDRLFGVVIEAVQEMLELPPLTALPGVPSSVRGVMNLRGRVVPVLDLRVALGMKQLTQEVDALVAMLKERQEDHRRWVAELESSVERRERFSGQADPTLCAFGRWFGSFQPANRQLGAFLERFDKPHRRIHELAAETQQLLADGRADEAKQRIAAVRNTDLAALMQLFDQIPSVVRNSTREVAVLLNSGGKEFAVSVDEVVAVETLSQVEDKHEVLESFGMSKVASGIAKRTDDKLVLLLMLEALTEGVFEAARA